ncbi:hypothetical protein CCACVL1_09319 [Corchorus capsularis]|uniref:Serine-threonine/tyrosine-protein kinase catalytic domain-containing protein n=1 Tax=Corchorus capsularis TaxID=210143 RepID=A0A1R3IWR1_COCAP|nr:hypothetical protein CCACVL1_09319 [Corchorus capsularis]
MATIKDVDLDRSNITLEDISWEAQKMQLIDHLNLLNAHSFIVDHNLWIVMPFMSKGSCLHHLKKSYPNGFEEVIIHSEGNPAGFGVSSLSRIYPS